ncbi:hypothetical protein TeGR_g13134 [Tetraparma gracilis]|uniref:Methyltransferase-domain-containing protein n=1 Tax=Tetraparma gracilis TaxID=2962635 RepID=A0ABQ6MKJ1_9STRA|nr:hypothetical protein TeGR_g13134 [Tetraparma gracilis]
MSPSPYLSVTSNFTSEASVETSLTLSYSPPSSAPSTLSVSTTLPESEISPLFSGTAWAGTRLWYSAVDSISYLHDSGLLSSLPAEPAILELGAGLGIPGMCLARHYAASPKPVVLTDLPEILSQLQANVASNFPAPSPVSAAALDWSVPGVDALLKSLSLPSFDLLLSTDCVYAPLYGKSYVPLAECIAHLLALNPEAVSVNVIERRAADEVEEFRKLLEAKGLSVEVVERGGGYRGDGVGEIPEEPENSGSSKGDDEEPRGKVQVYLARNPKR